MGIQEQMTPEQRIAQLEAQIAVLIAEVEELKKNAQHETIKIGDITLPSDDAGFLSALETVTKDSFIELLGYEKVLNCGFLWSIAMAKKSNDTDKENEALDDYTLVINHADMIDFKFDIENANMLMSEIQNKSWNEIVQMIRQMIKTATIQNENQGPQKTK